MTISPFYKSLVFITVTHRTGFPRNEEQMFFPAREILRSFHHGYGEMAQTADIITDFHGVTAVADRSTVLMGNI